MKTVPFTIAHIPAVLYGENANRIWLFVHGKHGRKEEAESFAETVCSNGWQVLSIDMPEHGQRQGNPEKLAPWTVVPELQTVMAYARKNWVWVGLRANSIGAWFSMLAFQEITPGRSLFVSPILNMAELIDTMMDWAGVTKAELEENQQIETSFGETLSWVYRQYALAHHIKHWRSQTAILYAGQDNLTSRQTVEDFCARFHADLTIMEDGEHWFHTPQQLEVLERWTREQTEG